MKKVKNVVWLLFSTYWLRQKRLLTKKHTTETTRSCATNPKEFLLIVLFLLLITLNYKSLFNKLIIFLICFLENNPA